MNLAGHAEDAVLLSQRVCFPFREEWGEVWVCFVWVGSRGVLPLKYTYRADINADSICNAYVEIHSYRSSVDSKDFWWLDWSPYDVLDVIIHLRPVF